MFERGRYVGDTSDWDIEKITLDRYERIRRAVGLLRAQMERAAKKLRLGNLRVLMPTCKLTRAQYLNTKWMDYPTMQLDTRKMALTSALTAATIVIAYAKGLGMATLPGLVEFMTVTIFVTGFCFGWVIGLIVGSVAITLYMLIPSPFAHPAAWIFATSPILLIVMAVLGAFYGIVGGILGKLRNPEKKGLNFALEIALWGGLLTFIYDIFSSVGFYLAYPVYSSVFEAIILTFIPLYYPYPPIIHTVTNIIVFGAVATPLIIAIQSLPFTSTITKTSPEHYYESAYQIKTRKS